MLIEYKKPVTKILALFLIYSIIGLFLKSKPSISTFSYINSTDLKLRAENTKVLIYNRVPKCGSTTITAVLEKSKKNAKSKVGKIINHVLPQEKHYFVNQTEAQEFTKTISDLAHRSTKSVYIRHVFFPRYKNVEPMNKVQFFNVIRHPIDQFISWYYYERNGWADHKSNPDWERTWSHKINEATRNLTIDQCIEQNFPECTKPGFNSEYLSYFCGQNKFCKSPSTIKALNQALKNLEEGYLFVGILEDLDSTLKILEIILPDFFSNGYEIYKTIVKKRNMKTENKNYPNTKNLKVLTEKLKLEIKLYNHVLTKFNNIKSQLI